ncbi:X-ray repair cross-complementing protein 6 [Strongyloides ratti]|uniref:X-ray repair cross-complementing protein 6 n=1 Tax=Strongyloides ratti TaxID=34506 RepID=A0A090LIS9_STRRB|nr:X-ray repair cross-complementing protein 6 [Strongyloides ratti]CEF68043.1 X-ray repair cross-complementing protein 6 [Strongyloides ratti]
MNYQTFSIKDAIIFIIDTGSISLSENFSWKLKRIFEVLRETISYICLTNSNLEEVCILLVNTLNSSKCDEEIASTYTFIPMGLVSTDMVKQLDCLLSSDDFVSTILQKTGGFGNVSLVQLFRKCNKLFNFCKSYKKKTIIFLTPTYDHFKNFTNESFLELKVIAKDLEEGKISVNIIVIDNNSISGNLTWNKIGARVDFCDNLDNLPLILKLKCSRTKCHRNISLYLTNNFKIEVDLYNIVDIKSIPKGFHIDAATNQVIQRNQVYKLDKGDEMFHNYDDVLSDSLSSDDVLSDNEYKSQDIPMKMKFYGKVFDFTNDEIAKIREIAPRGIQILGFRKIEEFKLDYIYSVALFVSAIEKKYRDKRIFFSLYNSCVNKNVFAVGRYVLKSNFSPQLVALIPTNKSQEGFFKYKGFYLFKMPFKENIRRLVEIDTNCKTNLCNATNFFVNKLTSNFTPLQYEDPMLERHYQAIEALALDKKITEMKDLPHNLS